MFLLPRFLTTRVGLLCAAGAVDVHTGALGAAALQLANAPPGAGDGAPRRG
jgi:hypothetical protein